MVFQAILCCIFKPGAQDSPQGLWRIRFGGKSPQALKNEAIARYSVLNNSKQLFASKYVLYLPTEEELERELERERRLIEETARRK
jgi:hypothetical protein